MRVIQIFFGTDLRCGHDGLTAVAKKSGVPVSDLKPGQFVVFVNNAKNKIKLYAANDVIAHWRARTGQQINLASIAEIPAAFAATGEIQYSTALKLAIEKQFTRKGRK